MGLNEDFINEAFEGGVLTKLQNTHEEIQLK
jgi:hypothetical protein